VSTACVAGETGNDVEHFVSTKVSVVFVLLGELRATIFIETPTGDVPRGDGNVPLRSAGRIFVRVPVTERCDDGTAAGEGIVKQWLFRKIDEISNEDGPDAEELPIEEVDDCNI
jgi:hypothetical protein